MRVTTAANVAVNLTPEYLDSLSRGDVQSWTLLSAAAINGRQLLEPSVSILDESVAQGLFTDFDIDTSTITLEVYSALPGDANGDKTVDAGDLNALALNWRKTNAVSWNQGDFNADGSIDASDLNDLALNWQGIANAAPSAVTVPEPSGVWVTISTVLLFMCRRRNRLHT
jgi:hypothetical protein